MLLPYAGRVQTCRWCKLCERTGAKLLPDSEGNLDQNRTVSWTTFYDTDRQTYDKDWIFIRTSFGPPLRCGRCHIWCNPGWNAWAVSLYCVGRCRLVLNFGLTLLTATPKERAPGSAFYSWSGMTTRTKVSLQPLSNFWFSDRDSYGSALKFYHWWYITALKIGCS